MSEAPPPITPASADPKLENRESIKDGVAQDLIEARRAVRDARMRSIEAEASGYSRADSNSIYLGALQNLISELHPFYKKLEICPEYWESDEGEPLAVLQTPQMTPGDLLEFDPAYREGHPKVLNPEVLEPKEIDRIECLPDLLELDGVRIGFSVTLKVKGIQGRETRHINDVVVLSRQTLDRGRQWALEFADKAGISLSTNDDRLRGRLGGDDRYGL